MNNINNITQDNTHNQRLKNDSVTDFQQDLLNYIRDNRPEGTGDFDSKNLNKLLTMMKLRYSALHPGKSATMSELSNALLYVDATLRQETTPKDDTPLSPDQIELNEYVSKYLDKYSCQLVGVNSMINTMMMKIFFPDEDEEKF